MQNEDVVRMIETLSIRDAPLVRRGVGVTLDFFVYVVRADPFQWIDYIKGIDFHCDVRQVSLPKGVTLARFEQFEGPGRPKPFSYFTKAGTSETSLGTNYSRYRFALFQTERLTPALLSRAADIQFGGRPRPGGGMQYIIPTSCAPVKMREGSRVHGA